MKGTGLWIVGVDMIRIPTLSPPKLFPMNDQFANIAIDTYNFEMSTIKVVFFG